MMRLPVATTDPRPLGLTLAEPGELVMVPFNCPDDDCDCRRWFAGLNTRNAATLALVCDVPIELAELRERVHDCLAEADQVTARLGPLSPEETELVISIAVEMVEIGDTFAVGAKIARRGDEIYEVPEDPPFLPAARIDMRKHRKNRT